MDIQVLTHLQLHKIKKVAVVISLSVKNLLQ